METKEPRDCTLALIVEGGECMKIKVDPILLSEESTYFDALINDDPMRGTRTEFEIPMPNQNHAELFCLVLSLSFKQLRNSLSSLGQKDLFDVALICHRFLLRQRTQEVMDQLSQRLTPGMAMSFLGAPLDFRQGPGKSITERAKEMIVLGFDPARGFGGMDIKGVCAILESNLIRAHENTIYEAVRDWWLDRASPKRSERPKAAKRLIELLKFDCMSPIFLSNVVKGDTSFCGDDEANSRAFADKVNAAFEKIAICKPERQHTTMSHSPVPIVLEVPMEKFIAASTPPDPDVDTQHKFPSVCLFGFKVVPSIIARRTGNCLAIGLDFDMKRAGPATFGLECTASVSVLLDKQVGEVLTGEVTGIMCAETPCLEIENPLGMDFTELASSRFVRDGVLTLVVTVCIWAETCVEEE